MSDIPDKLYFRIGDVSRIIGVKPYVLRYWETEFKFEPYKRSSKQRIYSRKDVELIKEIKRLLYDERYTIEGAKKKLKEFHRDRVSDSGSRSVEETDLKKTIEVVVKGLREIKDMLK